jgi:hypothetical protein
MPKRKCKKPEKPEKVKKPKAEDVPDLLAQWPSPGKVMFEPLKMKRRLSLQYISPPNVGIKPYKLFSLFIPEDLCIIISKHTSLYASLVRSSLHHAGVDGTRLWKPIMPGDIKPFFAAIFYMGDLGWSTY